MDAMKRVAGGLGPLVTVDRRRGAPLHRQLCDGYRDAILDGRLSPGQRLPSTRTLAEELGVSRIPVVTAFAQLTAEGYLESRVGAGTYVSRKLPEACGHRHLREEKGKGHGPRVIPPSVLSSHAGPWLPLRGPFRVSEPGLDAFPAALFSRLLARHARRMSSKQLMYGGAMGLPALREALAAHLATFRSVACSPDQILIVSGSQQALTLAWRTLLASGDAVWLEEPGYPGARDALRLAGASIVPVPVDAEGLDVNAGIARSEAARAVYVTPSHQYPLGVAMSAPRRVQLLDWASRRGAWIVEDDYDSEYRYEGEPLASLQGLDRDARVLYVGTFSKILFPALRIGYMVLPEDLAARFAEIRAAIDIFPPPLPQAVLAEFIREGHLARHLRRMRALYAERRRVLIASVERELGDTVRVAGDAAGMHLVLLLPPRTDDRDVALRAARRGVSVSPLSECYLARPVAPGLVLGFGSSRPRAIPDAVRTLRSVLGGG